MWERKVKIGTLIDGAGGNESDAVAFNFLVVERGVVKAIGRVM